MATSRALVLALVASCRSEPASAPAPVPSTTEAQAQARARALDPHARDRERMVKDTIVARGIRDERVLAAMRRVPRHELVPAAVRHRAYDDTPLPIGHDVTISQPFIVAAMTEAAQVERGERVLEIGTGSGYQAAVLAELGAQVYSIEIIEPVGRRAAEDLTRLGYDRIQLRIGDGYRGWPEAAPFDAIIITAAPPRVPKPLLEQLAVGGRLVAPVGRDAQQLQLYVKGETGTTTQTLMDVRFVPMTGEAQKQR